MKLIPAAFLDRSPAMQAALEVWTHRRAPPTPWQRITVPAEVRGELTGGPGADQLVLAACAKTTHLWPHRGSDDVDVLVVLGALDPSWCGSRREHRPDRYRRLVGMLALLWERQSRHVGAPNSRRKSQAEAEAAAHLAATLVQWISSGVLYRR